MKKFYSVLLILTFFLLKSNAQTVTCTAGFRMEAVNANPLAKHFIPILQHSNQKKPVEICWKFGDGSTECKTYPENYTGPYNLQHEYKEPGDYEVCVTIKYAGGCESKKCEKIIIQKPTTDCEVKINEVAVAAGNLDREFYLGLSANRKVEKICWNFGDGTSEECVFPSNPVTQENIIRKHKYAAPGNYKVCVRVVYAGGCVAEKCKEVVIKQQDVNTCGGYMTDIRVTSKVFLFKGFGVQNSNDEIISYHWNFGDGSSATGKEVRHEYAKEGEYNLCLTIKTRTGCETKICKKIVVEVLNDQPQLKLSPNPVASTLHVVFFSRFAETVTIKIYNTNGLIVKSYTRSATIGTNSWDINDLGALPTGAYSVVVQSQNQFANAIFFKQ